MPHETTRKIHGRIAESENLSYQISNNEFLYLNLGKRDGAEDGLRLARVTAVNRDNYQIHDGEHEVVAEITGKMLGTAESPLDPRTGASGQDHEPEGLTGEPGTPR
jgi:hypothetical protein